MKKIIFLLAIVLTITSCRKENEMIIEATITGLKKGTVYLQKIKDSSLINLDSVIVNGQDKFILSTIAKTPELYYVYVDKVDGTEYNDRITFFGEKGVIKIKTHLDKINSTVSVSGSKSDEVYKRYLKSIKKINNEIGIENIDFINAQYDNNQEKIISSDKKLNTLIRSKYLRSIQFALNNKKSPVAAYIGAREIPEANVIYLDSIYKGLSKRAKKTIYGQELADIIKNKK